LGGCPSANVRPLKNGLRPGLRKSGLGRGRTSSPLGSGGKGKTDKGKFMMTATIVKYGLYETTAAGKKYKAGLPYSSYEEKALVRHVETADTINAKIGMEFGISYVLDAVEERSFKIKTVVIYPEPGIRDADNNKIYHKSVTSRDVPAGAEVYEGYFIGGDTDIVEGTWIFQVWHNDHKLAEKVFHMKADAG